MKKVYTCFCTDVIHEGHLNILRNAKKYGEVTVGILCDPEMVRYNRFPSKSLEERISMVREIPEVSEVVVQHEIMYDKVLEELRPDYVVHGDNWKTGPESCIRENVLAALEKYGGELIEVPYTRSEAVRRVDARMREFLAMPERRRGRLRRLMEIVPIVKTIEVHSGLTGLIAEKTVVQNREGVDQFDAMWISSLCDSTEKGKPDIELVDMSSRIRTIEDVMDVTTKPIILDADTGGLIEHFVYHVRTLERMGVSAIILEDKVGLKKNSLFGTEVKQTQDTIEHFSEKISAGKAAQRTDEFMIIARIESLILEKGLEDAMERARAYVKAGADGIMIHSRKKEPDEVFAFCDRFRAEFAKVPLVVVPTSYRQVTEKELAERGVNIVIYANQLLRSAFPAMERTAKSILVNHRALEADEYLMPIKEIISLIDTL
ncbi:MAG: phosphoenolpyruvate mutase [Selenomonadaceae bacterium]|nr:phosphoenolpyruvate mutase [Selenomonadaceae bacterium]